MKIKSILACLLALSLAFFAFPLSAFATVYKPSNYEIAHIETISNLNNLKSENLPYGTLQRVKVGETVIECYQPVISYENGYLFEKYGLMSHLAEDTFSFSLGAWKFELVSNYSSGTVDFTIYNGGVKKAGFGTALLDGHYNCRYGFSYLLIDGVPLIYFELMTTADFSANGYGSNSEYFFREFNINSIPTSLCEVNNDSYRYLINPTFGGGTFNPSDVEVDIPGGVQTPVKVLFDSWTTCPNCGSHNISYKSSFLYSGVMVLTGQVGWVFKCRDCGASWKGITNTNEDFELFKQYIAEAEYSENLVVDSTLSPFTSTPSTVDLPSDVGGIGEYINQVFSALSSFTSSFNSFFSSVFAVLPAPVVGVILLGVGLVVIIGIIKAVRG